jgi:hypothetical protein
MRFRLVQLLRQRPGLSSSRQGVDSFDVGAPRGSAQQRPDCASAVETTMVDSITEEERAWAGIDAELDAIESIVTHGFSEMPTTKLMMMMMTRTTLYMKGSSVE